MATQLWLLRHGEAEPHGPPDAGRRLTPRGEEQSRAAGRAFAALDLHFHLVFTSPRVRALETARLALEAMGDGDPVVHEPLSSEFDAAEALSLAAEGERTLVVGHNPDFEQVVHDITGATIELKKGGVAGIRLSGPGSGELIALLRPRELYRLDAQP